MRQLLDSHRVTTAVVFSDNVSAMQKKKLAEKSLPVIASADLSRDFFPAIIHELRTPLNAIMGFSDLLSCAGETQSENYQQQVSSQELREYAKEISLAAAELNDLVNDLLDVSTANCGNFSVNLEQKIDVLDSIKRAVKLNHDYALARKIKITTQFDSEISLIHLDAKRMKQVITNLLSNAIKYSPAQTEIKISVALTSDNLLRISIADQGFGMSADQLQTAFVKYKTIPNPNTGKVDSFGLGLPIVKQLVKAQNGTIEIKSELDKGTEVIINFPYLV